MKESGNNLRNFEEPTDEDNNIISSCVYFSNDAFRFIDDYSRTDTSRELGGFLLGYYTRERNNLRVWVEAAVAAAYTETDKPGIRFTHQTWEHLKEEKDNKYPGCEIIGWFRTNPGLGSFMVEQDMFIHEMFFNSFWQVSYIIDSLSMEHAFYGWDKYNQLSPVSFKMEGEPLYIALTRKEIEDRQKVRNKKNSAFRNFGKIAIILISALFLTFGFNNYYFLSPLKEKINEMETSVNAKEEIIISLQSEINQLTEEPLVPGEPENTQEHTESPVFNEESPLRTYTVVDGDTLWEISVLLFGDGNRYRELAELNNINPPYNMKPGTVLTIPDN